MTETVIKKVQTVNTTSPTVEVSTNQEPKQVEKLITLKGITTSQVNSGHKAHRTHGQYPYPARVFLKVDDQKEDIPVFFRIKDDQDNWIRPKIKAGSYLEVQGIFKNPDPKYNQTRPSFTVYSYQILDPNLQGKFTLLQASQQLPHFEQELAKITEARKYLQSHE